MTTAHDLGEIDEDWFSGGVASITLTDLNFDAAYDEDWFAWFADDDWFEESVFSGGGGAIFADGVPLSIAESPPLRSARIRATCA